MTLSNDPANQKHQALDSEQLPPLPKQSAAKPELPRFEHPLMLKQSSTWSRAILWTVMGVAVAGVTWASFARIEEAIPAQGKLEPEGAVKDVQVPMNGVVKTVQVKEGQTVRKGDLLLTIDPTVTKAQLESLQKIRAASLQENQFYQSQMQGASTTPTGQIPSQFLSLAKSREALVTENQFLQAQVDGSTRISLNQQQQQRLQSTQVELATRTTAAKLDTQQLDRQLNQAEVKLTAARGALATNQKILDNITPLAQSGGISQIQVLRQQQDVETNRAEVAQLEQEVERLKLAISQAETKVENTVAVDRRSLTEQIAANLQRIADIDTQFSKAIVENNKRIAEIDSQIRQAQQTLSYGELRSPADGVVFELKAKTPGFVANITEPVLKIVPTDALVAKVSITNQDIGFIRQGMPVDVRIDSFPFSEFGDVKGTVVWIGSDAVPPTQIQPMYTFPAKIKLERQSLQVNGRPIKLQSGMSLTANVKIRQRTVMSIFLDQFTRFSESLNYVR